MSTRRVWYPEGFEMPTSDIVQLVDSTPAYNYQEVQEKASSEIGPGFVGATQATPDIMFRSREVKQIIDACPEQDVCGAYHEDQSNPYTVRFFCRAGKPFGLREADDFSPTNPPGGEIEDRHHVIDLQNSAFLCWETMSASQGEPAEINARFKVAWQDAQITAGVDPFVWSGPLPASLPTLSTVSRLFTLGPVVLNGQRLRGVQSVDWSNNITPEEQMSDGEVFPTLQGIREMAPVVTIRTTDAGIFDTFLIGTDRRGQALTDIDVYLRRMEPGQLQYPETDAQHIRLRINFGLLTCRQMQNNPSELELNIRAQKAPGNQFFTADTAIVIG